MGKTVPKGSAHRTEMIERLRRAGCLDDAGHFTEAACDVAREAWEGHWGIKTAHRLTLMWFNLERGHRAAAGIPFGVDDAATDKLRHLAQVAEKATKRAPP